MANFPTIIVFDSEYYQKEIIPSFMEGETNTMIRQEIKRHNRCMGNIEPWTKFKNLKSLMTRYSHDLSSCEIGGDYYVDHLRIYKNSEELRKFGIRRHQKLWGRENLNILFQRLVVRKTAKYYANLGRCYSMTSLINSNNSSLQNLIEKFEEGMSIWNDGGSGFRGVLDNLEVQELKKYLNQIKQNPKFESAKTLVSLIELAASQNLGLIHTEGVYLNISEDKNAKIVKLHLDENSSFAEPHFLGERIE